MKLLRKRFIPNEIVDISGDEILFRDEKMLVTRWKPINPRDDIGAGMSCVYFDLGVKVSKFLNKDGSFRFWYCDIVDYEYDESIDQYTIIDLLIDVVVYPDGYVEVLDEDELEDAYNQGLVDENRKQDSIKKKEMLLKDIREGNFKKYTEFEKNF